MVGVMVYGREGFNSAWERPNTTISMRRSAPEKIVVCFKTVAELRGPNSATVLKHTRNFGAPNGLLLIEKTAVHYENGCKGLKVCTGVESPH